MKRHDYRAAAEELGVKESWLRRNIKSLPHSKKGNTVTFTDADLERIDQMHHHEPPNALGAPVTALPALAGAHPLRDLKPAGALRRTG